MIKTAHNSLQLTLLIILSLVGHFFAASILGIFQPYDFSRPVAVQNIIDIDLKAVNTDLPAPTATPRDIPQKKETAAAKIYAPNIDSTPLVAQEITSANEVENNELPPLKPAETDQILPRVKNDNSSKPSALSQQETRPVSVPVMNPADVMATTVHEKLTYQISMFGFNVGSAVLEAVNEKGEVRISMRVKSDAVISAVYPVDDLIETRLLGGNYLLSTIRQQEGAFKSDTGFTICLREKFVLWADRMKNLVAKQSIPDNEVLDTLSGLYYLRKRLLQVGAIETLHIYDNDNYSVVPVEVLRRETVRLPNFKRVDTLVVRPNQHAGGIFRRTGDMLIWLTNDENKVPVKVETTISLGRVTAELIEAETKP